MPLPRADLIGLPSFIEARIARENRGYSSPCWVWQKSLTSGYARAGKHLFGHSTRQVHHWTYSHYVGEIPDGLELDHLCCVTSCVNPAHLEPVTRAENLRRKAVRHAETWAQMTHCKHGHALDDRDRRRKKCRQCVNEYVRGWNLRRKAA